MHRHIVNELFQNTVNNEMGINLSQRARLTEMMFVKTSVRQTTAAFTDIFKVLTDPYGSPKEMMCVKSHCSINQMLLHMANDATKLVKSTFKSY